MCLCIKCPKHHILFNLLLVISSRAIFDVTVLHSEQLLNTINLGHSIFFLFNYQAELHELASNWLILANGMAIFPCGCIFHCLSQSQPLFLPFLFVYQLLFGNYLFEHFQLCLCIKNPWTWRGYLRFFMQCLQTNVGWAQYICVNKRNAILHTSLSIL